MKDFYTKKSRKEGYLARSVYKLKGLNKRYNLIKKGDTVLDLGCSPGGWIQASIEIIGSKGKIIGIDLEKTKIKKENFEFLHGSVFDWSILEGISGVDAVLSDMAPKTTGVKELDQGRSYDLAKQALEIAKKKLKKRGNFICKIFQGKEYEIFIKEAKKEFESVKTAKPEASKKGSKEMYIIGKCKNT